MTDAHASAFPFPQPTPHTRPFWDACRRDVLEACACQACGHLFLPGGPCCPRCWAAELEWRPVSGQGEVFSYAVYRHRYHPALEVPYVVGLIQLAEGPRLLSNVVGCAPECVRIGLPVRVRFDRIGDFVLPRFIPAAAPPEESPHD